MPVDLNADLVLVDRQPVAAGPPTFVERGPFIGATSVTLSEKLNAPSQLLLTIGPEIQGDDITSRLRNLAGAPTEAWLYLGGALAFAGPILGYTVTGDAQGTKFSLTCQDPLAYVKRWWLEPQDGGASFMQVDQADIAVSLINTWQAKLYGHFGIDTSNVTPTGVLRDRVYVPWEIHNIGQRLAELGAVANGFDLWVDPLTRQFQVGYPERGQDLTETVIIDARSVAQPQAAFTVGPDDIASEGYVWSAQDEGQALTAHARNLTLRAEWGRCGLAQAHQNLTSQSTADDKAQRIVDERPGQFHVPTAVLYPIALAWEDFQVGDLVSFEYNYGAGMVIEQRRVRERQLKIGSDGGEQISVAFV